MQAALWLLGAVLHAESQHHLSQLLKQKTGIIHLPAGVFEVAEPVVVENATNLVILGAERGTTIRARPDFRGRALLLLTAGRNIRISRLAFDGNRSALEQRIGLPPSDRTFASFFGNNGILAERVEDLKIENVRLHSVAGFAVLASGCSAVRISGAIIRSSGSRNQAGRNNTSGGILFEDGTTDFAVLNSRLAGVRGNGIWTHSRYTAPRNARGRIAGNYLEDIARDAIQIGHATEIQVEGNTGARIGFPAGEVDVEGGGTPVAIDTAGNVDRSIYAQNHFTEINGKCIDLDGFHHGEVRGNTCVNRGSAVHYPFGHFGIVFNNSNPDMQSEHITVTGNVIDGAKYGGIFLIGSHHVVSGNRLVNLNLARCGPSRRTSTDCSHWKDEPAMLETGIYLGQRAERPAHARGNTIERNVIAGFQMARQCIAAASGVSMAEQKITNNTCRSAIKH